MSDSESIKYRIVGAAVIVVSFTFAWWLFLDHEVHRIKDIQADIPQPIKVERFDVKKPVKPEPKKSVKAQTAGNEVAAKSAGDESKLKAEAEKGKVAESAGTPDKKQEASSDTSQEQVKPAQKTSAKSSLASLDQNGLPISWVLQVASFQEKENADKLKTTLVAKDIDAYVKAFNMPDGKQHKVLVGPKLNKERLGQLAKRIEKEHGLKSLIMRYKPGLEE